MQIRADFATKTSLMSIEEAKKDGALALFGEKYGDEVRVVAMGDFSKELCGGTHVNRTGEIGLFKVMAETGVASGVRRIEACAGENALNYVDGKFALVTKIAALFKATEENVLEKAQQIFEDKKEQDKEMLRLQEQIVAHKITELAKQVILVDEVRLLALKLTAVDGKMLRQLLDGFKKELGSAIILLATVNDSKIQLVCGVTKDLMQKFSANELLQSVVKKLGGSGGGRNDMAQGGGTEVALLDKALSEVSIWVRGKQQP